MDRSKRKAAVAALITAGAIAVGVVAGGASSTTQARRDPKPPPWCGVICMGAPSSEPQELAATSRKAGKEQQEYLLAIPGVRGNGSSGGGY